MYLTLNLTNGGKDFKRKQGYLHKEYTKLLRLKKAQRRIKQK